MMKPGYRRARGLSQRGSLGPPASDSAPSLAELIPQLEAMETRLQQLKAGVLNIVQLGQLGAESGTRASDQSTVEAEMSRLQQSVDDFELELTSRLISWQHIKEPFWQAVRFGGLGIVVGWGLAWLVQRG